MFRQSVCLVCLAACRLLNVKEWDLRRLPDVWPLLAADENCPSAIMSPSVISGVTFAVMQEPESYMSVGFGRHVQMTRRSLAPTYVCLYRVGLIHSDIFRC